MATHNSLKLAVHIIESSFGNLVAKVCDCLLRKGTLSLQQVIKYTELSRDQVSNSLLVLIQHNCVQAFSLEQQGGFEKASKIQTQYMVLFDQIIHRMRFPKFIAIVQEKLDQQCSTVFGKLLQHGRLTLSQISEKAQGNSVTKDSFRESFIKLLNAHFVERCPVGEPFLPLSTEEEAPTRNQGAKSAKFIEEVMTIERSALKSAAPMDALRFSFVGNIIRNEEKSGDGSLDISVGEKVGEKRKRDALDREQEISEKEILLRANFEEFLCQLRHKACIANVRSRLDGGAAIVLNAIFNASANADLKVKSFRTVPLSLNNIFEEVMKSEIGRTMTLDHVRAALLQLGCEQSGSDADAIFSIDLNNIIHLAQNEEVESNVLKKYGKESYRIFRLLSKSCRLMQSDMIADSTFVEKKNAGKILFRLWGDNYLIMEKVAIQGSKQILLLWKINENGAWVQFLDDMFHGALNLRIRKAHELDREREILGVAEEVLTGKAKERRMRVEKMRMLLDTCLFNLDDAIMLFHHF